MRLKKIKAAELLPHQMFFSSRTSEGYICLRLQEACFRGDGQPVNAIVLPSDHMASPTLAFFGGDEQVSLIDSDFLFPVMAEIQETMSFPFV